MDTTATTYTVNQMIDRYRGDRLPQLGPRTQKDYHKHLDVLSRAFGPRLAHELKPRELTEWVRVPKGKVLRNRQLAVLSAVYQEAISNYFWIEHNPCRNVRRNPMKPRDRYVTDAEYAAFYAMHKPRMQCAMDLALLTGQRQGDLLGLEWSQIQDMTIVFKQAKTGKKLAVQISAELERVLDRCWQLAPDGNRQYVLCTKRGGKYTSEGFRAIWQRLMRKYAKDGNERFTFHDLRAKSASDAASDQEAADRLGHSDARITRRVYRRLPRRASALSILDSRPIKRG